MLEKLCAYIPLKKPICSVKNARGTFCTARHEGCIYAQRVKLDTYVNDILKCTKNNGKRL